MSFPNTGVVWWWFELTGPVLYVRPSHIIFSRDTCESDLKQRREVRGSTVVFVDQIAVDAAVNGKLLLIEGVEKAERNVLPLLNNLLGTLVGVSYVIEYHGRCELTVYDVYDRK